MAFSLRRECLRVQEYRSVNRFRDRAWFSRALAVELAAVLIGIFLTFGFICDLDDALLSLSTAVASLATCAWLGAGIAALMMHHSPVRYWLNKDWALDVDPRHPERMKIHRPADGKFFSVLFNPRRQGQPYIQETCDKEGIAGVVCPLVRWDSQNNCWLVATTSNPRVANGYEDDLVEAYRASRSNTHIKPPCTDPYTVLYVLNENYANSNRIAGRLATLVIDMTGKEGSLPPGLEWLPLKDFCLTSDMMGQAAILQWLVVTGQRIR